MVKGVLQNIENVINKENVKNKGNMEDGGEEKKPFLSPKYIFITKKIWNFTLGYIVVVVATIEIIIVSSFK